MSSLLGGLGKERGLHHTASRGVLPEGGDPGEVAGALAVASRATSPRVPPCTQYESHRPEQWRLLGISSELWVVLPPFHRRGP